LETLEVPEGWGRRDLTGLQELPARRVEMVLLVQRVHWVSQDRLECSVEEDRRV